MTRTYELLRKLRIQDRRASGSAITSGMDLFGDKLSVSVQWDEEKLHILKTIQMEGQNQTQWLVKFSTAGHRLRLDSQQGIPPQETGCISILNWIAKDLIQFPPFTASQGNTHEPARPY